MNNNDLIEDEMNLSPDQNMFDLPDSVLIKELKSLNSSGKKMNEQKINKYEIYSQFCLNGDLNLREKNSCIVQLRDQFK